MEEMKTFCQENLDLTEQEIEKRLEKLISKLAKNRNLMRFKDKSGKFQHISRVAETIRTTSNLHEFQDRETGREEDDTSNKEKYGVLEGTQWMPIMRHSMPRIFDYQEIEKAIKEEIPDNLHESLKIEFEVLDLVLRSISKIKKFNNNLKFSKFQLDSIKSALIQSWVP